MRGCSRSCTSFISEDVYASLLSVSNSTYKPTDSDLEDDDDDEEDEEEDEEGRPSWFDEDDQDDGIKGQDIIEPDYEDLSSVIRIDEARIPWSIPREE